MFDVERSHSLTLPSITSPQWSSTTTRSPLWAGWRCSPTLPDSVWVTTVYAVILRWYRSAVATAYSQLCHAHSSHQTASTASSWITTVSAICMRFGSISFLNSNCWCWMITKYLLCLVRTYDFYNKTVFLVYLEKR